MQNADPNTPSTLGQRIDALLGPLEIEARQYREAIDLGRGQVRQMQGKIGQAEEALAEIESKMARVLETLTREEPMLASAISRQAQPNATEASVPQSPPPEAVVENAAPPAEAASAAVSQDPQPTPPQPPTTDPDPEPETDPMRLDPPPKNDNEAVDEIMGLLAAGDNDDASASTPGSLAEAADRAEQAAQRIDAATSAPPQAGA